MAGYTLYDILRTLVERVGWPSEVEKNVVLASIAEAEQMQIFGNLAKIMECDHPDVGRDGKCVDCKRQISNH